MSWKASDLLFGKITRARKHKTIIKVFVEGIKFIIGVGLSESAVGLGIQQVIFKATGNGGSMIYIDRTKILVCTGHHHSL
jgi:NADH:ubiquinone oxidoreductase subunit K